MTSFFSGLDSSLRGDTPALNSGACLALNSCSSGQEAPAGGGFVEGSDHPEPIGPGRSSGGEDRGCVVTSRRSYGRTIGVLSEGKRLVPSKPFGMAAAVTEMSIQLSTAETASPSLHRGVNQPVR
jgi:hypothetical protein